MTRGLQTSYLIQHLVLQRTSNSYPQRLESYQANHLWKEWHHAWSKYSKNDTIIKKLCSIRKAQNSRMPSEWLIFYIIYRMVWVNIPMILPIKKLCSVRKPQNLRMPSEWLIFYIIYRPWIALAKKGWDKSWKTNPHWIMTKTASKLSSVQNER